MWISIVCTSGYSKYQVIKKGLDFSYDLGCRKTQETPLKWKG